MSEGKEPLTNNQLAELSLYKHLNTTRKKKCCIYLHCLRRCVHAAVICLSQTCECTSLTACRSQLNKNCS